MGVCGGYAAKARRVFLMDSRESAMLERVAMSMLEVPWSGCLVGFPVNKVLFSLMYFILCPLTWRRSWIFLNFSISESEKYLRFPSPIVQKIKAENSLAQKRIVWTSTPTNFATCPMDFNPDFII